jgi:chemotaxis protein MotB
MKKKLSALAVLAGIILLCSCGTNKKLKSAMAEIDQLKAKNSDLTNNVNSLQKQVSDLTASNKSITDEYNSYKASCEVAQKKLQVLRAYMEEQYATLQQVEKKLEEALANFENKGVEVFYRDGLVYVEMEEALMYKSGSAMLGDNAKTALGNLASVLNDYPKLKVYVVGNTDDVQFKKGSDNWSLSTERANGVVRILRDDYKVDPARLTSAGKGKYNPVADNSNADGRAKNRRTDIILNPDLERIWRSVQQ